MNDLFGSSQSPSDLELDRYRLGEMSEEEAARIRAALDSDEQLRARLEELKRESDVFAERVNLPNVAAETLQRANATRPTRWPALLGAMLRPQGLAAFTAAIAVVAFVLMLLPARDVMSPADQPGRVGGGIRIKGNNVRITVRVQRENKQFNFAGKERLIAGDLVRFVVETAKEGFLYVVIRSGSAEPSIYAPEEGEAPIHVKPGQRIEVPGAYQLDASAIDDEVYALLCKETQELANLRKLAAVGVAGESDPCDMTRVCLGNCSAR